MKQTKTKQNKTKKKNASLYIFRYRHWRILLRHTAVEDESKETNTYEIEITWEIIRFSSVFTINLSISKKETVSFVSLNPKALHSRPGISRCHPRACAHIYACNYVCTCLYMHVCVHVCTYVCMSVSAWICIYICVYVCMYVECYTMKRI